ncbi:hypothetical protein [Streptomyces deccanensis]|uniref:hypothetical protein n=1 Tax=Streptomyces deccanensis TaxID=424188 RepID=UPI001EFA9766|nr:hypothetical protein [Streptomyces deccanensis]ULR55071.1 hypothetical protein L3078_40555 [Streptomyces deccanensis]
MIDKRRAAKTRDGLRRPRRHLADDRGEGAMYWPRSFAEAAGSGPRLRQPVS